MQKRNNKKSTAKMDMPFLEKFMVPPDDYAIFKFGGTSLFLACAGLLSEGNVS